SMPILIGRFCTLILIAFIVVSTAVIVLYLQSRSDLIDTTDWTPAQLHKYLSNRGLQLHFVSASGSDAYYFSRTKQSKKKLLNLPMLNSQRSCWKGIARCHGKHWLALVDDDGDPIDALPHLRLPTMNLVGDPLLLEEIHNKLKLE